MSSDEGIFGIFVEIYERVCTPEQTSMMLCVQKKRERRTKEEEKHVKKSIAIHSSSQKLFPFIL